MCMYIYIYIYIYMKFLSDTGTSARAARKKVKSSRLVIIISIVIILYIIVSYPKSLSFMAYKYNKLLLYHSNDTSILLFPRALDFRAPFPSHIYNAMPIPDTRFPSPYIYIYIHMSDRELHRDRPSPAIG